MVDAVAEKADTTAQQEQASKKDAIERFKADLIGQAEAARASRGRGDTMDMERVAQLLNQYRVDLGDPALDLATAFVEADTEAERVQIAEKITGAVAQEQMIKAAEEKGTLTLEKAAEMRDVAKEQAKESLDAIKSQTLPNVKENLDDTLAKLNDHANNVSPEATGGMKPSDTPQQDKINAERANSTGRALG